MSAPTSAVSVLSMARCRGDLGGCQGECPLGRQVSAAAGCSRPTGASSQCHCLWEAGCMDLPLAVSGSPQEPLPTISKNGKLAAVLVVAAGPTSHVRSVASKRPPAPTPSYHADTHPDLFGTEAPCVVGLADSLRVRHTAIPHAANRGSPPSPAPTDASAHTRSHTHNTDTGNRKRARAQTQSQRAHPAPSLIREASSPGMSGARQPPRSPGSGK